MRTRMLSTAVAALLVTSVFSCGTEAFARERTPKPQLEIPHCVRPIGTVAVVEPTIQPGSQPWWTGMGLGSPELVLKAYVAESKCFKLVNRGQGMETAERERALAAAGILRPRSSIGKGQVTPADFVLTPNLLSGNDNASGSAVAGLLGAVVGGQAGAFLGGLSFTGRTAKVIISVTNVRSSEEDSVVQGEAKKIDIGWGAGGGTIGTTGMGALAGGGYTNTELGQVIMTAYLDAYIKLVNQLGGITQGANPADLAPKPALVTTAGVKMREGPSTGDPVVRTLAIGTKVYPTGEEAQGWIPVEDAMQYKGWVSKLFLQPAT